MTDEPKVKGNWQIVTPSAGPVSFLLRLGVVYRATVFYGIGTRGKKEPLWKATVLGYTHSSRFWTAEEAQEYAELMLEHLAEKITEVLA